MRKLLHLTRLQRKVLVVVVVIMVVPMVISGFLSASWIAARVDTSIEQWVREGAQVNKTRLARLHDNHRLFAQVLAAQRQHGWAPGEAAIPPSLQTLAQELGISLLQIREGDRLLYSLQPQVEMPGPAGSEPQSIVRVTREGHRFLAAVTSVPFPGRAGHTYSLVLGTIFDKPFLQRLDHSTGLKTRLFYPEGGNFEKAFSEETQPLRLELPTEAFEQLQQRQEYYSTAAEGGGYFGLYTPLMDSAGHAEAILFSGLSRHGGDRLLADRALLTPVLVLLGTAFAIVVGYLLSRLVVRPVEYLHQAVVKVAARDFRAIVPIKSQDELGELAGAFNTMAERLREARDEERREFQRDKITALGELSLAMAHEIRNPIGVIHTAAQLLEKHSDNAARRTDLVRMIREESQRLNQLLRDFQQLARHRRPEFALIDPTEPLEKALRLMLAGREEVQVARDYGHGNARVRGDPELLQQAWANLVRNALEAIGTGAARLAVASRAEGHDVVVTLEDNGPGIPPEMIGRLFEPFFTTKEQGTGLGLTIANTLAEANGGRLELAQARGGGACIAMRLPQPAEGE